MEQAVLGCTLRLCHSNNLVRINVAVTLTGLTAKLTLCLALMNVKQGQKIKLFASLLPVDPFRAFRIHKHKHSCAHTIESIPGKRKC